MVELIQVFIDKLFQFRRGLLRQVLWLDDTIEKLTTLKEMGADLNEADIVKLIGEHKKNELANIVKDAELPENDV